MSKHRCRLHSPKFLGLDLDMTNFLTLCCTKWGVSHELFQFYKAIFDNLSINFTFHVPYEMTLYCKSSGCKKTISKICTYFVKLPRGVVPLLLNPSRDEIWPILFSRNDAMLR